MASTGAFITMMEQFLNELVKTFPEEKCLKKYSVGFDLIKGANPRKVVTMYMDEVGPYQDKIMAKDESFFLTTELDFLSGLNVKKWWTPDLSVGTKDAVWQYLQTLTILGMTITSIPADTLKQIETIAEQAAGSMADAKGGGGGGGFDMSALTGLLGGLGGLGSLGGAGK